MKKLALAIVALLISTPAIAQSTKAQLNTEVSTNYPDNTIGAITPSILRTTTNDQITSWQQAPTVNAQSGTSYTVQLSDYGKLITLNNASAVAVTIPAPTGSFVPFNTYLQNNGLGTVTITPSAGTIGGNATATLPTGQVAWLIADGSGTNYAISISGTRTRFAANTTLYIRSVGSVVTISNNSPAVVTHNAHGYSAGQHVVFNAGSSLPNGMSAGTVYCVLAAGLSTNTYEFSATCGGSAVNTTSSGSGTFVEWAGNDTNTGQAQTAAGAFMTLQGALNYVQANYDLAGFTLLLQAADAVSSVPDLFTTKVFLAGTMVGENVQQTTPQVVLQGNTSTPDNVQISCAANACVGVEQSAKMQVQGFYVANSTSNANGMLSDTNGQLWFNAMDFGAGSGSTSAQLEAHMGGMNICLGNYTISGGAGYHMLADRHAKMECSGVTVTVNNTPAFGTAFAGATDGGLLYVVGNTYSGSATGARCVASQLGIIETGGSTIGSYFPGNSNCSPSTSNTLTAPWGLYN